MKTIHLYKHVMAIILMMSVTQQLQAQDAFYIYRNDGNFDGFFFDEIVRMGYSKTDLEGNEHDMYVIQEIETEDSLYRIPLAAIDSIGFQQPEIRLNPKFKNMDELGITPYVTSIHSEGGVYHLGISKNIPSNLLPQVGDVVASWDSSIYEGSGFVVKIREKSEPYRWYKDENDQSYYWIADMVTELGDVFDQYITVEDIGVDEQGNTIHRRIAGCNPDGTIRRAHGDSGDVNLINLSGTFSHEWKPEDDTSFSLSANVGVVLKLRVAYNINWSRLFVKMSRDLIVSAEPSLAMSVSRGFDVSIDDFLPFKIPVILFPATCPIFQTSPIPEWFVRGEGKLEAKLNLPAVQLGIGEDIIIDTRETFPISYVPRLKPAVNGSVDNVLNLESAEVSLSGYIQTGLKFKADLMTASWFSKIFEGDIGLFLYCGPKVGGQITYKPAYIEDKKSIAFYNSLKESYLHSALLSLDLEAKATAAALWGDPVEKKFFDKNWSFYTDTVRFVPLFDPMEVNVNGNKASVTIHPKGGRTLGYCTMTVGIYDVDDNLVKTVGDWTFEPGRDSNYYTKEFSMDDMKSNTPYTAHVLLKWAGNGPIKTGVYSPRFYKTPTIDISDTHIEFDAKENPEKRIRFTTDAIPASIEAVGNGIVKAVIDTLDIEKGQYEAVFTITPNETPFWDDGSVYLKIGNKDVEITFSQKPNLEPIKFKFSSGCYAKMHKTDDANGTTEENDWEEYWSSNLGSEDEITYTVTPLARDKVKLTASTTTTTRDNYGSSTKTTNVEFTMAFKKNESNNYYSTSIGYRIFEFDIEDGKYITEHTESRSAFNSHSKLAETFASEGCRCTLISGNYVNKKLEYLSTSGNLKTMSYDYYFHTSSSGEFSGYHTVVTKGTLKDDDSNSFHLTFGEDN